MPQVGKYNFPEPDDCSDDNISMMGADLKPETMISAYTHGFFPWHTSPWGVCWYHPQPRMVIQRDKLRISKSMRPYLNGNKFEYRENTAFEQVLDHCAKVQRPEQDGTWIWPQYRNAMLKLHEHGTAFCAEAWRDDQLVGGAYGLLIGRVFHGESMFSLEPNASKFAFISMMLRHHEIMLVDCQVPTPHLQRLGGEEVSRIDFLAMMHQANLKQ